MVSPKKQKKLKIVYNTCTCESHKMDSYKKYPVKASGVRDGLSGDMLVSSRRYLVIIIFICLLG